MVLRFRPQVLSSVLDKDGKDKDLDLWVGLTSEIVSSASERGGGGFWWFQRGEH